MRFECPHCRQKIAVADEHAGKKGRCLGCKKIIIIPQFSKTTSTGSQASISVAAANKEVCPVDSKKPICDDTDALIELLESRCDENINEEKHGFFIPYYDEVTLFSLAVITVLLYLTNSRMRKEIHSFLFDDFDARIFFLIAACIFGIYLCIHHAFVKRQKSIFEKHLMLCFAVIMNAAAGICAGSYLIEEAVDWLIIFPIWNVIYGVTLLAMLRFKMVDESNISDRNATSLQLLFGLMLLLVIFGFCNFYFRLYWAVTCSICVAYVSSFDRALRDVLHL